MKFMREKVMDYIKKNLKKGYTVDSLKFALESQGYSRSIVERAIEEVNKELAAQAPVLKDKPKITYQIIDEHDRPITLKKPWWKRVFD